LQTELRSDQNFFKQSYSTKHFIEQLTQTFKLKNMKNMFLVYSMFGSLFLWAGWNKSDSREKTMKSAHHFKSK